MPSTAALRSFLHDFPWIHQGITVFGNFTFVVGSVFFLFASLKVAGIWLFIVGTLAMFLGSVGQLLVTYENRQRET